jgi:hypothetical protein
MVRSYSYYADMVTWEGGCCPVLFRVADDGTVEGLGFDGEWWPAPDVALDDLLPVDEVLAARTRGVIEAWFGPGEVVCEFGPAPI